jgi:tight adherence protein C
MRFDPVAVVGALSLGLAAAFAMLALFPPPRRLRARLDPYTVVARSKLGAQVSVLSLAQAPAAEGGSAVAQILGPMVSSLGRRLAALAGTRDDESLARLLSQAGAETTTPASFRRQQLFLTGGGALLGIAAASANGANAFGAVVLGSCGLTCGLLVKRSELNRRIARRREQLRAELYSVCESLAIAARANPNLQSIVEEAAAQGRGEVAAELRRVLAAIRSGTSAEAAFRAQAEATVEPAAARLYRSLATAATSGGDIADALLPQADDLRHERRERYRRRATRRRLAMVGGFMVELAPLALFVFAAFPSVALGR